jgi:hypothetical protein
MSTSNFIRLILILLPFVTILFSCVTGAQSVPGPFQFTGVSTECSAAAEFSAYGIETTISLEPSCASEGSGVQCSVEACVYALGLSKCETLFGE